MVADRLASLGTLTAGLGHDMNNLLFPLRCRLAALDARQAPQPYRQALESAMDTVDCLQQLTDGLRLFAMDPDDTRDILERTNLSDWWRRVSRLLQNTLPANVTLEAEFPEDLPPVAAPAHGLTQILLNLLVNAGEAQPNGGRVRVEAARVGEHVRLSVRDRGTGMTPEVMARAFDPFYTTKTRRLSTGLGLSLVHGLVTASRGRVELDSDPGHGTTVTLTLPAASVESTPTPDRPDVHPRQALVSVANPHTAAWVSGILRSSGFAVERDQRSAPAAHHELWVTDPGPDRVEAARALRAMDCRCRIVVLGEAGEAWREVNAM
ncbi:MAG: sensor histidine kinase, partial [Planctomycetota bacterium]